MRRRSVASNPVLTGAATVLVVVIAVFLAYNANSGLPLVATYDLTVEVPDAARLVEGNEVRVGGRRVGTIKRIVPTQRRDGRVFARLDLRLDMSVAPLPADTTARVRPRSTLGLKYLELTPGEAGRGLKAGETLALNQSRGRVELDQALAVFDSQTRLHLRGTVEGLSTGLAGRGADVNRSLADLGPFLRRLVPVMRTLAAPETDLRGFVRGVEGAMATLAPVSGELRGLLRGADTTLGALERERDALEETLVQAPPTLTTGTRALRRIGPVVGEAAELVRALRPGTRLLPGTSAGLADLARRGEPVLRRAVDLGPQLDETLRAVGRLVAEPSTGGAVRKLTAVVSSLEPTLRAVNPFQVDCNYLGVWTRNASSTISEGDELGTWFRFIPIYQPSEIVQASEPAPQLHVTPYPNVDGECEAGNEPYLPGRQIGNPPGRQPNRTQTTAPPKGVPVR
jgi:virulence factor Mce-like protein